MPFYAVAVGKVPGVYKTWEECQNQTKGFPQAKFKKFNSEEEASNFIKTKISHNNKSLSYDATSTSFTPLMIENLKHPELKAVSNSSRALLKQDKLSIILEKLENFIEQTNNKFSDFSQRLDVLENAFISRGTLEKKRSDTTLETQERSRSKKIKVLVSNEPSENDDKTNNIPLTRSKSQTSETIEEVDSPWNNNSSSTQGFVVGSDGFVVVYTDGACTNNGKIGAKAGIGVWFNHTNPFNVAAPVEGNATNNNAEIQAATRAILQAQLAGIKRLNIHTDSQFMINCMTDWIKKWKKNNWVTSNGGPVKNKEQLVMLDSAIQSMENVKWTHIRGHIGIEGNECADALARNGATMYYSVTE